MEKMIITIALGIFCIVLGVINRTGNISSIHSYHRKRVSEENRLPFGKLVGLGTIIIGAALIVFGMFSFVAELLTTQWLMILGIILLIVGIVIGLVLNIYAMIKYNKGIF